LPTLAGTLPPDQRKTREIPVMTVSPTVETHPLLPRIEQALDTIRPYLAADGGNVRVLEITDDMVLRLELLGACGTCPMSPMTLKAGVEESVKKAVPEIRAVEAINVTPMSEQPAGQVR
jgi:Fe-S cluster biogenesis protein NfuA